MTTFTEGRRSGEFLISKAHGNRSMAEVTLTEGEVVQAGQVLGKVTSGGKYVAYNNGAGDGSQTAVAISLHAYDATDSDLQIAVVARDAEVIADALVYETDADEAAAIVDLAAVGIFARTSS